MDAISRQTAVKLNYDEVMYQLILTDANAYDIFVMRRGLETAFKQTHNKVECWSAAALILKTIAIFK
tara:strand:- start:306 stop:506 length:201 start_codon:yes stop_codon:yes gene_type:complete